MGYILNIIECYPVPAEGCSALEVTGNITCYNPYDGQEDVCSYFLNLFDDEITDFQGLNYQQQLDFLNNLSERIETTYLDF